MHHSRRFLILAAVAAFLAVACTPKAPEPVRPSSRANPPKPRPVAAAPVGCSSASLLGTATVGGLGDSLQVPALPGADRVSYGEVGNSQYVAEASAPDVLGFYQAWMPKLCWQARALSDRAATYARGDQLVRLTWAEREQTGRVLVNYESNVGRVLAATYSAAQTTCPSGQFSCYNVCVPDGSPCSPSGGTTGGTTCPAPPSGCTSGYTYDSQGCATGCITSTGGTTGGTACPTPPTSCTNAYTYDSQGCATGCAASTGGTTGGTTSPTACSADQVRCYGTGDSWGWCQYPPCPSSTGGTTSATPTTQSDCSARAMYWCTSSGGNAWCQSWSCPVECPSGQYSCNGACVSNTTSCGGGSTSSWPQTQAACSAESKTWCPGSNGSMGWCQSYPPCPSNTGSTGSTWPSTQTDCTAQGKTWCPSSSTSSGGACYYSGPCPVTCPSGQYSCNGVCKPTTDTNCAWTGGGGGATACPSDQWQCDGSCISMTSPCRGWYPNGTQSSTGGTATGGTTTGGTGTACPSGFYWCPASNSCMSNTAPCGTTGGQTGTTGQVGVAQPQQCGQCKYSNNGQCTLAPQGMTDPNCASGQLCDGYGGCATIRPKYVADGALCPNKICEPKFGETRENCPIDCGGVTVPTSQTSPTGSPYPGQFPGQGQGNEGQFPGQPGQFPGGPGGPGGFPGGPGGPGGWGPSEEEMKKMQIRQLEDMKRGMREARRGMEQMKKEITRRERDAKRCGTVVPPEAKNALEAMGPLLAKIEAAQTVEEAMDAMSAMQEVGEELRDYAESGFRDAPMLCEMKKRAPTEMKRFEREAVRLIAQGKRVKNNEGLVELARELETKVVEGKNQLAKALGLIATDPEAAVDAFEEMWMIRDDGEHLRNALRAALDARRVLPELKRDMRRTETELKRFAKSGRDVSEAQDLLEELKAAVADLEQGIKDKVGGEELVDLVQIVYAARASVGDAMASFYGRGEYEPNIQIRDKAIDFNLPDAFDRQSFSGQGGGFGGSEGFGGPSGGLNSTAPGAP